MILYRFDRKNIAGDSKAGMRLKSNLGGIFMKIEDLRPDMKVVSQREMMFVRALTKVVTDGISSPSNPKEKILSTGVTRKVMCRIPTGGSLFFDADNLEPEED